MCIALEETDAKSAVTETIHERQDAESVATSLKILSVNFAHHKKK
ncbi:MAG: hypothetical protein Q8J61_04765 [Sulfuricella sp.]|nr:hypothetical protein [Sulfuricella sp.]